MHQEQLWQLAEAPEPRAGFQPGLGGVLQADPEQATEILIIRHGQMPASTNTLLDEPLTDIGRQQADVLGRFLAGQPLHAIYSSPALRARQTAEAIGVRCGREVSVVNDLREAELYLPEGTDWQQLQASESYQEMTRQLLLQRRWDVYGELRESGESMRHRITGVLDELIPQHRGQRIALVTHGPIINALVGVIMGSPYDLNVSTSLTGVTIVLATQSRWRLLAINSRAHFGLF